jgi:hypothetical protein
MCDISGGGGSVEHRRVAAFRDRDDDAAIRRTGVVLAQSVTQPARVDTHDRIGRRVEIDALSVQLDSDHLLFEGIALPGERLVDNELQKSRKPLRAGKQFAGEDSIELGSHE